MELSEIFELLKNNDIQTPYVERIYQNGERLDIVTVFPNGRIYNYYGAEGSYELGGPFITIEGACKPIIDDGFREIWSKEHTEIDREINKIDKYTYEITFNLTADIEDVEEGQRYLDEDDFTPYIKDKLIQNTAGKIDKIEYRLKAKYYGDIYITTNDILTEEDKKLLKDAISDFQINELNDGWVEQEFANKGNSEFKPLPEYKEIDLKSEITN